MREGGQLGVSKRERGKKYEARTKDQGSIFRFSDLEEARSLLPVLDDPRALLVAARGACARADEARTERKEWRRQR